MMLACPSYEEAVEAPQPPARPCISYAEKRELIRWEIREAARRAAAYDFALSDVFAEVERGYADVENPSEPDEPLPDWI